MTPLDRFLKIGSPQPATQDASRPTKRVRFTDVGDSVAPAEPGRSGGEPERFTPAPERPVDPPIRVREDDGGPPFIRCRVCRIDNPVGARVCSLCDADLTTSAQRNFNEALWDRTVEERALYEQEAQRLETERRRIDAEYSAAVRELGKLRLGQIWHDGDLGLFRGLFADVGRVIGRRLVRAFPDRRERLFVLGGVLVILNLLTLWWVLERGGRVILWSISLGIQLAAILKASYRTRRG